MELTVSGWSRHHGEKILAKRDLTKAQHSSPGASRPQIYVTTSEGREELRIIPNGNIELRFYAKIVLNGEYVVRQTLTRKEVARLFLSQYQDCSLHEILEIFEELKKAKIDEKYASVMLKHVSAIDFPKEIIAWLKKNNLHRVGDLAQKTEVEMRKLPDADRYISQINEILTPYGLQFGMEVDGWQPIPADLLRKIDDFDFSVRTAVCLKDEGVIYVGDLVQYTERQLIRLPGLGRRSINEIRQKVLDPLKLEFGMNVPNWPYQGIAPIR